MIAVGRRTLARSATVRGRSLHGGRPASITFQPGPPGSGIVFRRSDLAGPSVRARADAVTDTSRQTTLGGPAGVRTVEHVLAAIFAARLDDVLIALDGPEPPAADGSAAPYLTALRAAGCAQQPGRPDAPGPAPRLDLAIGDARYRVRPSGTPTLTVVIAFTHPLIGRQEGTWPLTPDAVADALVPARTFGFAREAPALRAQGLALGAGTDNTLVLTDDGLAGGALRWPDEFVRHKALDLVGDLVLAGPLPAGDVTAIRPSHAGNVALARVLATMTPTGSRS